MHIYTHMDVHTHRSCTRCNFSQHVSADAYVEKNKWIICWCRVTSRCLFPRAEELVNVSPDPVASSPVSFHTQLSWDTQQANLLENPAFSWGARLRWVVRIAVPCFAWAVHWQRASSAVLCPLACAPRARSFSKDPSVLAAHLERPGSSHMSQELSWRNGWWELPLGRDIFCSLLEPWCWKFRLFTCPSLCYWCGSSRGKGEKS